MLVNANAGTVDHDDVAVAGGGHRFQNPVPDARLPPPHEAIVAGSVWSIALRDIPRGRARPEAPENTVQDASVVDPRHAHAACWPATAE